MGHTKPENIADLAAQLDAIRSLDGIKEKNPGVFYYKSTAFMHFHDKDGQRWADVKTRDAGYRQVPIAFGAGESKKKSFLKAVLAAYSALASLGAVRKKA